MVTWPSVCDAEIDVHPKEEHPKDVHPKVEHPAKIRQGLIAAN